MEGIADLYAGVRQDLAARAGRNVRPRDFVVRFREYAGLRNIIYDRGTHYEVRLSALLRAAPLDVQSSLARVLLGKIDRRLETTRADADAYRAWARQPYIDAESERLRRERGWKRMGSPQGRVHDLEALFHLINADYFEDRIDKPRLGWTLQRGRSLYGHQDPAHGTIVINRWLDHPRVPVDVVGSVLHHEMLHIQHGVRRGPSGRRILHSREFRADERTWRAHAQAQRFLKDLAHRRIRLHWFD